MTETKWTLDGYEVTPDGRVFSIASDWRGYGRREMRQHEDSDGYLIVRLTCGDRRKKYRVHQLVVWAHIGPPPTQEHEIRHLDGNPKNNTVENLCWGTRSENARDRVKHGRQFYPPWHDPEFHARQSAAMRRGHARQRANGEGRYAK